MNFSQSVPQPSNNIHCAEEKPRACGMVIFGASGDLTFRKLLPSLFSLFANGYLPDNFFLLGFARTQMRDEDFRQRIKDKLSANVSEAGQALDKFVELCHYQADDYQDAQAYERLNHKLRQLSRRYDVQDNLLFYLSMPPSMYQPILEQLGQNGLLDEGGEQSPWRRVIFEKPFGHDLPSSRHLETVLASNLKEEQVYRIDHYLGKETVQNIMILRFANSVFEPLWNRRYIDHVQITVAEDIGIEHRAGYFDSTGLLRDMFQNHLLQIMALIAMEPPVSFAADHVRDEKVKLLNSVHPLNPGELPEQVVRGQYSEGRINGEPVPAYRQEEGVEPESMTETFAAMKLFIENWRWKGVPFYLRSGKRLAARASEAVIVFKEVPHSIFHPLESEDLQANTLKMRIQPQEGVCLGIQAKRPGPKLCLGNLNLSFRYEDVFQKAAIDAYARLLLDAMLGDQTLFLRSDNIDIAWQLLTPILEDWRQGRQSSLPLHFYAAGSETGPEAADNLLNIDQRSWLPYT